MTDEPAELVEPWLEKHGVTHPVVILPDQALENAIGVDGFPTSAVFLGKEKQWKGHPSSSGPALSEVRKNARKDSVYPKKFSKVINSVNKREYVKALADLRKILEKLEGDDLAWGQRLEQSLIEGSGRAFTASDNAIAAGFWHKGVAIAEPYLTKGSLYPMVEETLAKFAELQTTPLYAKEMSGGALYLEAQGLERNEEYVDAVKTYKSIIKKCAGTQIASHAETAALKLIQDRRPGYKPSCPTCQKNKGAACSKHHEEMKL